MDITGSNSGFSHDLGRDLAYFTELWAKRGKPSIPHSAELWDKRAESWISADGDSGTLAMSKTKQRARDTAEYLRARGLLRGGDAVADIGCGSGIFAAEFAATAGHVTGIDYSERFLEYGRGQAGLLGLKNITFKQYDFTELDVAAEGYTGAFDLVFSSITPAVTVSGAIEKLMSMSRAWCCNVSVAAAYDSLSERVGREVFGGETTPRYDGTGFYALYNLLLLSGYFPETFYFSVKRETAAAPARSQAETCARYLRREAETDITEILRFLEKIGETVCETSYRYGLVLWDIRERNIR